MRSSYQGATHNHSLPGEDPVQLQAVIDGARRRFQPTNAFEQLMVDNMAIAIWRQSRFTGFESRIIALEALTLPDFVNQVYPDIDTQARCVLAYLRLSKKTQLMSNLVLHAARNFTILLKAYTDVRKLYPDPA